MTTSQKILALMEEKNIKQKQLADFTGISTSAISDWKKKGTNPSVDKIGLIADCLGVSVDYLLDRTDQPNGYNNNQIHNSDNVALGENAQVHINNTPAENIDEMTAELIKRFQSLSFDEKIEVFNYIKNIKE